MYDFYEILEVSRNASPEVIKAAYRRLSQKYHPDHDSSEAARQAYLDVQTAYEVLSDPQKREAYDNELKYNEFQDESKKYNASVEIDLKNGKVKYKRKRTIKDILRMFGTLFVWIIQFILKLCVLLIASPLLLIRFVIFFFVSLFLFWGLGLGYNWIAMKLGLAIIPDNDFTSNIIVGLASVFTGWLVISTVWNILFGDGELL